MPPTKLSLLKDAAARGDWTEAIRIANAFGRLGDQRGAIKTAWGAIQNPGFYRQLRRDPDALVASGVAALKERYAL